MYLDSDIDIYWYYNNRNDDSDGGEDCGNGNILVGTIEKSKIQEHTSNLSFAI